MVREFGGCSKWVTTNVATPPDSGYGYLVLLTLIGLIQVDSFYPDKWSGYASILVLLPL